MHAQTLEDSQDFVSVGEFLADSHADGRVENTLPIRDDIIPLARESRALPILFGF